MGKKKKKNASEVAFESSCDERLCCFLFIFFLERCYQWSDMRFSAAGSLHVLDLDFFIKWRAISFIYFDFFSFIYLFIHFNNPETIIFDLMDKGKTVRGGYYRRVMVMQ